VGAVHSNDSKVLDLAEAAKQARQSVERFSDILTLMDGGPRALDTARELLARATDDPSPNHDVSAVQLKSPVLPGLCRLPRAHSRRAHRSPVVGRADGRWRSSRIECDRRRVGRSKPALRSLGWLDVRHTQQPLIEHADSLSIRRASIRRPRSVRSSILSSKSPRNYSA
jgi:hypothetical protein